MSTSHWFIGGGAEHTAEMARQQTYASMGGAEGIAEPADLQVLPLNVPGGGVRVTIGSGFMKAGNAGAHNEMYMGSVVTEELVTIPPNDGGSTRRDLIVMRVHDPYWQGSPWPDPGSGLDPEEAAEARANAQYVFIERIGSVPAGTTRLQSVPGYENDTALTLARIDIPGSTGTVITSMITNLRKVARPRREEVVYARPRENIDSVGEQQYLHAMTADGGEVFPGGAGVSPNAFYVDVPAWATRMVIDARWMSVYYAASLDPRGQYWMEYGDEWRDHTWPNKQQWEFATQKFNFNSPLTNDERTAEWSLMDEVPVPAKLRGKRVRFIFCAGYEYRPGTASNRPVRMTGSGGLGCRITFAQTALASDLL